jgi:DNA-binding MarR family transcriptional regulator
MDRTNPHTIGHGDAERRGQDEHVPIELLLGGGSLIHLVGRELDTAMGRQLAPLGLTAQQAALLLWTARQETSPSQLVTLLGTDSAGVSRLLDRLETKGLIRRRNHPDDRRSIVIELTAQGLTLVPRLPPIFGRISMRLLAGFSAEEVQQLTTLLERMLGNLRSTENPVGHDPQVTS